MHLRAWIGTLLPSSFRIACEGARGRSAVQLKLRASQMASPVPHREQNSALGVMGAPVEFSSTRGKNGTTLPRNLDGALHAVKCTQVHDPFSTGERFRFLNEQYSQCYKSSRPGFERVSPGRLLRTRGGVTSNASPTITSCTGDEFEIIRIAMCQRIVNMRSHSAEVIKPFACAVRGEGFSRRQFWGRHRRSAPHAVVCNA
jgi:hypothetical protein